MVEDGRGWSRMVEDHGRGRSRTVEDGVFFGPFFPFGFWMAEKQFGASPAGFQADFGLSGRFWGHHVLHCNTFAPFWRFLWLSGKFWGFYS